MGTAATPVLPSSVDADFQAASRIAWAFCPHEQSTPNMTVRVDAGAVFNGSTLTEVAAQNTGTITAPSTHPRIDRVVIDQKTGSASVVTGTEATSPTAPAIPHGTVPIAQVSLTTSTTTITNSIINDERVLNAVGLGAIAFTDVYNVKDFGAIGDGTADDTVAIQTALDYVGGIGGGIIYIPQGVYKVMPQEAMPALPTAPPDDAFAALTIKYSNITVMGDGKGLTKLLFQGYGDVDPTTNWQLVHWDADYLGDEVYRGTGLYLYGTLENITLRNFEFDGGCTPGNTGDGTVPADPSTGDGWDISHKGIAMLDLDINAITLDGVSFHNWRGEIIYGGHGEGNGNLYLTNSDLYQTNADGISITLGLYAINNRIYECLGGASESLHHDMPMVYRNNYIADCGAGINFQTNYDTETESEIRDNIITRCGIGIWVNQESRATWIDSNHFIDNNPDEDPAGKGDIALAPGVGNSGRNHPVITGFTISNNRFEKRSYGDGYAIEIKCTDDTAPVTGQHYELSNIEISYNITSSSQDALADDKRYLTPINLSIGLAPADYTQNITIHDNTFLNPQRDISSTETGSTNLSPMPLMWNNTCFGISDFFASSATTDGSTTTILNNAGIATIIDRKSLSGVQLIFSDVSGTWKTPVFDTTNYRDGQYLVLAGSTPDGVMIPYANSIFACRQGRYLETDTYLVLKYNASTGRFIEQQFIDNRTTPYSIVGTGNDLAFSGRDTLILALGSPDYFDTFSQVGDLAVVTVHDAVGNATIRHNSNIVLLDGENLSMAQNQVIQFYRGTNDKLIQIGDEMANRIATAFEPHEQLTPNMTVALEAGAIFNGTTLTEVSAQSTSTITAPSTNPRIDRIVVDQASGAVSVVTGTPGGSPTPPAIPAGKVPVAQVLLQTTSTAITNSMITDERVLNALGLGSMAFQNASNVTITGGTISGLSSPIAVADGGTGATTASGARTNLGLGTAATHNVGDFLQPANNLSDISNATTARTNLGLGSIATQSASSVSITGGSITGITDLAVADGGTGVSTLTAHGVLIGNGASAINVTSAGTAGQVLTSNGSSADPTFQDAPSPVFSQSFTSSDQTITYSSVLPISHSLGVIPTLVSIEAVCQSSEFGYTTGNIIGINPGAPGASNEGLTYIKEATVITVIFGGGGLVAHHTTLYSATVLTAANWKLRVRAFA